MHDKLQTALKELPRTPGVYFFKNKQGDIIYIGKAAVLSNRVRQYFQKSRQRDTKTDALVADIAAVEWTELESEMEALFLEAELIRRYRPHYNILLRDDKSSMYIRVDQKSQHPTISYTRRPFDDGAQYFGPYYSGYTIKQAMRYLRKVFPYSTHYPSVPKRACLQYHIGLCPGLEESDNNLQQYKADLKKIATYLRGKGSELARTLEAEMKQYAKAQQFEKAALIRNQLLSLRALRKQVVFSSNEFLDISKDHGLNELQALIGSKAPIRRIEGFDISHMQGTDTTASMVVFSNGLPDKAHYRKFKLLIPGNDDYAHMKEVITRRFNKKNIKAWGVPQLCLIDGGKGQLQAALEARSQLGLEKMPMIGLAKQFETIIIAKQDSAIDHGSIGSHPKAVVRETDAFYSVHIPDNTHIIKLLQRIRDESHRFAVSYHSVLKVKRQTKSTLDDVPGIGPKTRQKLLKQFGSLKGVLQADNATLVKAVGATKAQQIRQALK